MRDFYEGFFLGFLSGFYEGYEGKSECRHTSVSQPRFDNS